MPSAVVFKNQLLSATKDVRGAIDLCEETLKLLRADLDKGKKPAGTANRRSATIMGTAADLTKKTPVNKGPPKPHGAPPAKAQHGAPPKPHGVVRPLAAMGKNLLRRKMSGEDDTAATAAAAKPSTRTPPNGKASSLKVVVRKRPLAEGEEDCVECVEEQVQVREGKVKVDLTKYVQTHVFEYDDTFDEHESTGDLYERSAAELIENFYQGGTSTCFCFGQTASGKTFTMFGAGGGLADAELDDNGDNENAPAVEAAARGEDGGLYMLAAEDVFRRLEARPDLNLNVSMFEIYGQKVRDLLSEGRELQALEDGKGVLQLVGLAQEPCTDMEAFLHTTNVGRGARSTTATDANATSSRSHAAMLLRLVDGEGKGRGKFSFIDLAGAERGADHETGNAKTKMEGRQINQSLLALKEVIRAKSLGRSHAPYRQSRLTQVLEESLTGSTCHTTVIGCISPCQEDIHSTVNTLRYAESLHPHPRKAGSKVKPKPTKAMKLEAEGQEAQAERLALAAKAMADQLQRRTEERKVEAAEAAEEAKAAEAADRALGAAEQETRKLRTAASLLYSEVGDDLHFERLTSFHASGGGSSVGRSLDSGEMVPLQTNQEEEEEEEEQWQAAETATEAAAAAAAERERVYAEHDRLERALAASQAEVEAASRRAAAAEAKMEETASAQARAEAAAEETQQQERDREAHKVGMKAGGGGGSSGSGRRGSTVPEGTMSHAAKFLQDNPTMRKSLHREDQLNRGPSYNNPLHSDNADDDDDDGGCSGSGGGGGAKSQPQPHDALSDVLAEFGEEALFSKVHKSQPSDNGSAPSETMFNGLEELLALGPDGVHDLGVPRIEAKKLVKRAGEMAEVRRLLVDCGVDAGKWFEPLHRAGVSRLDHLRDLGRDPLVNFGLPPEQAEKVVAALSAGRPMGSEARGGNTNGGTRGRASSTPPPLQRKAPRTPNLSAAAIGSPM